MNLFRAGEETLLHGLVKEERSSASGRHSALARTRRNAASNLLDKLLAVIVADVQILKSIPWKRGETW